MWQFLTEHLSSDGRGHGVKSEVYRQHTFQKMYYSSVNLPEFHHTPIFHTSVRVLYAFALSKIDTRFTCASPNVLASYNQPIIQ